LLTGKFPFDDTPVLDGGEIVLACPDPRGELLPIGGIALLECLERSLPLLIKVDAYAVEIVLSATDGKITRPVVLDPLQNDRATGIDSANPVWPGPKRRRQ